MFQFTYRQGRCWLKYHLFLAIFRNSDKPHREELKVNATDLRLFVQVFDRLVARHPAPQGCQRIILANSRFHDEMEYGFSPVDVVGRAAVLANSKLCSLLDRQGSAALTAKKLYGRRKRVHD